MCDVVNRGRGLGKRTVRLPGWSQARIKNNKKGCLMKAAFFMQQMNDEESDATGGLGQTGHLTGAFTRA